MTGGIHHQESWYEGYLAGLEESKAFRLDLSNRSQIESNICGAIRSAIDAHGPVDKNLAPSAAKRIYGQLKSIAREQQSNLTAQKNS